MKGLQNPAESAQLVLEIFFLMIGWLGLNNSENVNILLYYSKQVYFLNNDLLFDPGKTNADFDS